MLHSKLTHNHKLLVFLRSRWRYTKRVGNRRDTLHLEFLDNSQKKLYHVIRNCSLALATTTFFFFFSHSLWSARARAQSKAIRHTVTARLVREIKSYKNQYSLRCIVASALKLIFSIGIRSISDSTVTNRPTNARISSPTIFSRNFHRTSFSLLATWRLRRNLMRSLAYTFDWNKSKWKLKNNTNNSKSHRAM